MNKIDCNHKELTVDNIVYKQKFKNNCTAMQTEPHPNAAPPEFYLIRIIIHNDIHCLFFNSSCYMPVDIILCNVPFLRESFQLPNQESLHLTDRFYHQSTKSEREREREYERERARERERECEREMEREEMIYILLM